MANISDPFDENSDLLNALFQPNINIFCILEKNGSILKVNQGWTHILGTTTEDLYQHDFLAFVHPEDRDVSTYALQQLITKDELLHFVNRYQDRDGNYCIISWCIHYADPYLFVAGNDQTKLKSMESKFLEEQEQLSKMLPLESSKLKKTLYESLKLTALLESTSLNQEQTDLLKSLQETIRKLDSVIKPSSFAAKRKTDDVTIKTKRTHSSIDSSMTTIDYPQIDKPTSASTKKQKILIVDDSILNRKLLETALSDTYEISSANCGEEALSMMKASNLPDLILLDIIMPKINGFQVCEKLQKNQTTKDIPIVFLTSLSEHEDEEYGLRLGAIDYITKPFSIPIVKAKIKNYLALKYYQDLLKKHTDLDQLTQIANRRRFDEVFSIESRKAIRYRRYLSLLLIDIDHFKQYNDTYGHLEGDHCLQQIALTLKNTLKRPGDFVARWGGEEFVCLLPDTDSDGACIVAERLREAICLNRIPHESSPVLNVVTVSIGVVTSDPQNPESLGSLMKLVDIALYNAKDNGRNRISVQHYQKNKTPVFNQKKRL